MRMLCECEIHGKIGAKYGKLYVRENRREKGAEMFKAYMCYNGSKKQYTDVYQFDTREELENAVFDSGYDIIDDNDRDMWVDAGDMDDFVYIDDDVPSWKELMQDRYPTCDDGTVFSTMSGF